MVKKSRRFAVRQAALARRKKTRRTTLTEKQRVAPGSSPEAGSVAGAGVAGEAPGSDAEEALTAPQPSGQGAMEPVADTPWRYAYVLADIRRIGMISGAMLALIVILTFFLR